jgi:hypothetical protein
MASSGWAPASVTGDGWEFGVLGPLTIERDGIEVRRSRSRPPSRCPRPGGDLLRDAETLQAPPPQVSGNVMRHPRVHRERPPSDQTASGSIGDFAVLSAVALKRSGADATRHHVGSG